LGGFSHYGDVLRKNVYKGSLFEWYGESGGQLKYYPFSKDAIWSSERFKLEPLNKNIEYGILAKVASYLPKQWAKVQ
jgi:hypothetical protein